MAETTNIHPVILCGGSGTRLWPLSRTAYPKQLLALVEESTLLQATAQRCASLQGAGIATAAPILVSNEEHRFLVRQQLQAIGCTPAATYLEPQGRNTAPAIALAALHLAHGDSSTPANPQAVMLVLPADHVVRDCVAFAGAVARALPAAHAGWLVTFGIVPSGPETGYGYIQTGTPLTQFTGVQQVQRFVEKPDSATAQRFIDTGGFCWNSGMFMFTAERYLQELQTHRPDILDAATAAWQQRSQDQDFCRPQAQSFIACPSDSIDYAVMQPTTRAAVVPVDMGWSDVGSWDSLWTTSDRDALGNVVRGDIYHHGTRNSYLRSENRLLAVIGMDNVVVVETADAVLVMHKDQAQSIKQASEYFAQHRRKEQIEHRRVHRPWGWYEGVDAGERFQVKRIMVEPGAQLSLQMHHHRAEHWIVVSGTAKVTIDGQATLLSENQSTYIPLGKTHRLENPGKLPLHLIEVQSGSYLGEDDIVRFEDHYGRPH